MRCGAWAISVINFLASGPKKIASQRRLVFRCYEFLAEFITCLDSSLSLYIDSFPNFRCGMYFAQAVIQ